jgi:hypothetical protein
VASINAALPEASRMERCWECESAHGPFRTVRLPLVVGQGSAIRLCLRCYERHYLLLIREIAGDRGVAAAGADGRPAP